MSRILSSITVEETTMTHQRHLNASIWLRLYFSFFLSYALSTRIMIMPVLSSFRLIREGEVWGGLPARDSRKTGVVAPGDSCFIPHEAREGVRVDGHGDWSPTSPSVSLSARLWISSLRLKLYFPPSPAIRVPGPRCSSLSRKSF